MIFSAAMHNAITAKAGFRNTGGMIDIANRLEKTDGVIKFGATMNTSTAALSLFTLTVT
jgi:hypothetical protein